MTELSALHSLALQKAKVKDSDIIDVVSNIEYSQLNSFAELKQQLYMASLEQFYPKEICWNEAISISEESQKLGIEIVSITSPKYPTCLKVIKDAPPVLHLRGNITMLQDLPGVSIVGTRKSSRAGSIIAQRISNFMATNGWIVVSGLALGIDTAAHEGALLSSLRGSTIAVLAHGLEAPKPKKNEKLAYDILDAGGLWVSEHPIFTPPRPPQFVARNRIQLGLSAGSIIVEAEPGSGSFTQAMYCLKQRRPLFAVIPQDSSNRLGLVSRGTELLVQKYKAMPIKSIDDYTAIVERLSIQKSLMETL